MTEADYEVTKHVARANRAFYRAFEKLDLEAMQRVWLDDPSVRCIHPGSDLLIGAERIMDSWRAIFAGTEAISFEVTDLSVELFGEHAWVTNGEEITAHHEGEVHSAKTVATNLYRLHEGDWRMVLHHASPVARHLGE